MQKQKYTTKRDAVNKGLVKKNGVFYKQSLLEVWHAKGWLELENSRYGADDRLRFGLKFALDSYVVNRVNLHSGFSFNVKVDSSGAEDSRGLTDAKTRYRFALRHIPAEFWPIVRQICIDEKEPVAPAKLSERQKTYFYFLCRVDLCRGLDRIIDAYTYKLKK